MSEETATKVYVVKTAFEHEGLSYAEGEKYELAPELVATLPEGSVEEFVPEPAPETGAISDKGGAATEETKTEATPAKPWVGGHTVGRE